MCKRCVPRIGTGRLRVSGTAYANGFNDAQDWEERNEDVALSFFGMGGLGASCM